jgi:hypothetical protein
MLSPSSEDSSRGLLGCDDVYCCGRIPTFQRSMLPPSSEDSSRGFLGCDAVWCCGRIPTFQRIQEAWTSETLMSEHKTTRRHNLEYLELNIYRRENPKSRETINICEHSDKQLTD